jgi:hypothetical protein
MGEKEKQDEIKVEDRRYFDRDGNPVTSPESEQQPETTAKPREATVEPPPQADPKPDFITVLFSFVHTALVHLGEIEDPIQKGVVENLRGARQMIDTLELFQEKTKGNLNKEEEEYLKSALFDLRMRFMQKAKIIR